MAKDIGGAFGAILTDLTKSFDCLSHEILIAKLFAYGFEISSLRLIYMSRYSRMDQVKFVEDSL